MENRVTFGRRGLTAEAAAPMAPLAAATPAMSGHGPIRPASYESDVQSFSAVSSSEISRLLAMVFSSQGRMSRVHYCVQSLISSVAYIVALIALRLALPSLVASLLILPLSIAFLWSFIAIRIKRWHDRDKSGWWCLLGLLPVVGWVWSLVECRYLSGTQGPNRFGEDPRNPVNLSEVFA